MKRPNDRLHPSARLRSLNETEPGSANPSATDNFYETQDARHSDLSQESEAQHRHPFPSRPYRKIIGALVTVSWRALWG